MAIRSILSVINYRLSAYVIYLLVHLSDGAKATSSESVILEQRDVMLSVEWDSLNILAGQIRYDTFMRCSMKDKTVLLIRIHVCELTVNGTHPKYLLVDCRKYLSDVACLYLKQTVALLMASLVLFTINKCNISFVLAIAISSDVKSYSIEVC